MTAGFQCYNASGTFQIDGMYPQFVMRRKVVLVPNNYQAGDNGLVDNEYYFGFVTLADDEVLAIRSTDYAAVVSKQDLNVMIIAKEYNTTVECFIFGQITDVGNHQGFQVFNPSGVLVFDAMQKIMAMVGFPEGVGDFYYAAGRKYAAIVMNQSLVITEELFTAGASDFKRSTATRGLLKGLDFGISVAHIQYWKLTEVVTDGMNYQAVTSTAPNRIIVVDVTNY